MIGNAEDVAFCFTTSNLEQTTVYLQHVTFFEWETRPFNVSARAAIMRPMTPFAYAHMLWRNTRARDGLRRCT